MIRIVVTLLFLFCAQAHAIVEGHEYPFNKGSEAENRANEQLFRELAVELRCPKCQNQNLADSNATISSDLRRELYNQILEGKNREEIIDFMVDRYGEFVLYRPKVNTLTYALWYGPIALLALVLLVGGVFIMRRKRINDDEYKEIGDHESSITDDEQARIEQLLNNAPQNDKGDKDI
ncbi:cytochrome c-type biogenesis protein CcmH [Bermanella sp. R86510]|uniref:cytochrome c-type biogenesis protein n=1 Tax=unclassified Bermanella TaxID=2627862 RepID=UPI0037CCB20C